MGELRSRSEEHWSRGVQRGAWVLYRSRGEHLYLGLESHGARDEAEQTRRLVDSDFALRSKRRSEPVLVDEVADPFEDAVVHLHPEQARIEPCANVVFEMLEDGAGKIGLCAKHPDQRGTIGWVFVIAGEAACWLECQR